MIDAVEEQVYYQIINNPDLFEEVVKGFLKNHPEATPEQVHMYIVECIKRECIREADEEKKRRQRHLIRDRILSKTLSSIDSGVSFSTKSEIKETSYSITNSSTAHEVEHLADLLDELSTSHSLKVRHLREASDDINRSLKDA